MVDIEKTASDVRTTIESHASNAATSLEKSAGDVQKTVETHVAEASTAVEGRTVEVRITDTELKASANDDLSELKTAIRKQIKSDFGYDITVIVGIEAER